MNNDGPRRALRVLGVDLGLKRTGLAVSDPLGLSVRPLENLQPKSRAEDVAHLVALCAELEVEAVAVGHPLMPQSGDSGPMAKRAAGFSEALRAALMAADLDVGVFLVDERDSSTEAAQRLVTAGVPKKKRRARLDAEAACILVERFLEDGGGERVD
jgi:putative Holliday junction resolvase